MKRSLIALAFVASAATAPVQAQSMIAEGFGALTGAALCSQVGGGSGRYVASATCAVIGANIARNMTAPRPVQGPPVYPAPMPPQVIYPQDTCLGDGYYKGEYNPAAARAYCRGLIEQQRRARAQAERDAYYEGMRSVQQSERDAQRDGMRVDGYRTNSW